MNTNPPNIDTVIFNWFLNHEVTKRLGVRPIASHCIEWNIQINSRKLVSGDIIFLSDHAQFWDADSIKKFFYCDPDFPNNLIKRMYDTIGPIRGIQPA